MPRFVLLVIVYRASSRASPAIRPGNVDSTLVNWLHNLNIDSDVIDKVIFLNKTIQYVIIKAIFIFRLFTKNILWKTC